MTKENEERMRQCPDRSSGLGETRLQCSLISPKSAAVMTLPANTAAICRSRLDRFGSRRDPATLRLRRFEHPLQLFERGLSLSDQTQPILLQRGHLFLFHLRADLGRIGLGSDDLPHSVSDL